MGPFPICGCVNTNKTKRRSYMGTTQECSLEQIPEATSCKKAALLPQASHLSKYPSKMMT